MSLVLVLLSIRALPQTPAHGNRTTLPGTHTFNSSLVSDTIQPGRVTLNKRPLQAFQMRAQLLAGPGAATTVTLSGINLTINTSPSTCDGNNGTVVVSASGGTAPYQYQLDGNTWSFSGIFFGSAQAHTLVVKDAAGQTVTTTVTITNTYDQPSLWPSTIVDPTGCLTSDGSITVSPLGGTPPYTYSMDHQNWQTSPTFTGLGIGWYYIWIRDANGCTNYANAFTRGCSGWAFAISFSACGASGLIEGSFSPYTPNPPYSFSLDGINYQNTIDFSGLAPGRYTLLAKDNSGKLTSFSWNIADICYLTLKGMAVDAVCNGVGGSITATAINGTAPYQYSIDGINYQTGNVFSGLTPGNYTLVVKDAAGSLQGVPLTIGTNCLTGTATSKAAYCSNSDGSITATSTGGTPPYQYSIDGTNFQSSGNFTGLAAGPYTVSFKDNGGTLASGQITVFAIPCLSVTATPTAATCAGYDGKIDASATGGNAAYTYSIDGTNFQIGPTFTGLAANNYSVTVKDAYNRTATFPVTVSEACLHLALTPTDASCGNTDGRITATASNGTTPYTYSIDGTNYQTSPTFPTLAPGPYSVTARDAAGLTAKTAAIIGSNCISIGLVKKDVNCNQRNGSITVSASGSNPPFQYSLDGISFQTTGQFSGIAAGPITVTVMYAHGYTKSQGSSIANIPAPQIGVVTTAASCRNDDGAIQITATGGTAPYQYSIDGANFQSSPTFTGLATNTYPATIKDAGGCMAPQPSTVALSNTLTITAGPVPTICEGQRAPLSASSNGRTFSWQPATGLDNPSLLQPTASPSLTTLYTVTATDGACQQKASVNVIVNPAPTPDAGQNSSICYGASTQLQAAGGTSFTWTPSTWLSDPTLPNPKVDQPEHSITYYLSVTDANGCGSLTKAPVTVTVTPPPQLSAGADTTAVEGQPIPLNAVDVNGTGFTKFNWSPADGLNNPFIQDPVAALPTGVRTYTVRAVSDAGCAAIATITIKVFSVADIFVPSGFSPNGDGINDLLKPRPVGIREFKYFAIFSRWGQRIFFSSDPSVGWTGSADSNTQAAGTYVWMAAGIDYSGKLVQRKGTVTLVRYT